MAIDFLKLIRTLADGDLDFVIVGGVAARLHGSTRLTHDLDIVPRLEPESWGRTIDALWRSGARPRIPEPKERVRDVALVREWVATKGMLALTLRSPDGRIEVDFLVGHEASYESLATRAATVELDGRVYRVASIEDLIAMKTAAGRPQDLLDVETLQNLAERAVNWRGASGRRRRRP